MRVIIADIDSQQHSSLHQSVSTCASAAMHHQYGVAALAHDAEVHSGAMRRIAYSQHQIEACAAALQAFPYGIAASMEPSTGAYPMSLSLAFDRSSLLPAACCLTRHQSLHAVL